MHRQVEASTQLLRPLKGLTILHPQSNLQVEHGMVHRLTDQDLQDQLAQLLVLYILLPDRILLIVVHRPIMPLREDR